jgi:hypothetical protein
VLQRIHVSPCTPGQHRNRKEWDAFSLLDFFTAKLLECLHSCFERTLDRPFVDFELLSQCCISAHNTQLSLRCLSKILEASSLHNVIFRWNFNSRRIIRSRPTSPLSSSSSSSFARDKLGRRTENPSTAGLSDVTARCDSPVMPRRPQGHQNGAQQVTGIGIAELNINNSSSSSSSSSSGLNLVVKARKTLRSIMLDTPESCKKGDPKIANVALVQTSEPLEVDTQGVQARPCSVSYGALDLPVPPGEKNASVLKELRTVYLEIGM